MENLSKNSETMSAKEWALTIFITSLPLVGIIMLFVWGFDSNTNIHKQNYAKGSLLLIAIGFAIILSFLFLFGGIAMMSEAFN